MYQAHACMPDGSWRYLASFNDVEDAKTACALLWNKGELQNGDHWPVRFVFPRDRDAMDGILASDGTFAIHSGEPEGGS
ncbi:MAG: hypothetical protein OXD36_02425 [Rhodobacter sp.]|nr:hypothetical protein [Rhodobacter sp.]